MICPFCGTSVQEGFTTCTGCRAVYRHDIDMERSGKTLIVLGFIALTVGLGLMGFAVSAGGLSGLLPLVMSVPMLLYGVVYLPFGIYSKWKSKKRVGFYPAN